MEKNKKKMFMEKILENQENSKKAIEMKDNEIKRKKFINQINKINSQENLNRIQRVKENKKNKIMEKINEDNSRSKIIE